MTTAFPISSAEAKRVLQQATGKTIAFCHAQGACVEADEHGVQECHTLWGNVRLSLGETYAIALHSQNDKLSVSGTPEAQSVPDGMATQTGQGVYFRGLGDFTAVTNLNPFEDEETSSLIIGFEAGNLVVFEACAEAISVTFPNQNTTENSLWAERLQAAHHA